MILHLRLLLKHHAIANSQMIYEAIRSQSSRCKRGWDEPKYRDSGL